MDHNQAIKLDAVERYLLEEMTPQERDDFEEHYFDCHDCATELRATAAFMDAAEVELKANPVPQPKKSTNGGNSKSFFASLWPTMLVWSALAASLLVIVYQNAVVFPRFQTEIAELRTPEVLPVVSLVRGNSRGAEIATATISAGDSVLLSLDIPTQDRFNSYTCLVYSPSGALLGKVPVSAQAARDTIEIAVPGAGREPGKYSVTVQGNTGGNTDGSTSGDLAAGHTVVDLSHDSFILSRHQ
jgi:hypothetical protein